MFTSLFSFSSTSSATSSSCSARVEKLWCLHPGGHHPGRSRKVSTQDCQEANFTADLQCLPCFTREHTWIRVLQAHLSSLSFFQSFTVITPPIQATCRSEARSRHLEEHLQVGEDHTVGEDIVLAAPLGPIPHQPWHQVQDCRAPFVITAVCGQVPPTSIKLGYVSPVISLPAKSQMASPQGHKINNIRKVVGIFGISLRLAPGLLEKAVITQRSLAQYVK